MTNKKSSRAADKIKNKVIDIILGAVLLALAVAFVAKFGGPAILKFYVEIGTGGCRKLPILCLTPAEEIINLPIDKEYLQGLTRYDFSDMEIYLPKPFTAIKEKITKVYYKKQKRKQSGAVVYLLHKEPDFFINLFPTLKKLGIKDDYDFLNRTMNAQVNDAVNLNDAFFVIMKSVFTPNLGEQKNIRMLKFVSGDKKGFINYNLTGAENYFDCNIVDGRGDFFKIYIKDKGATLDLDKVLAIVSTLNGK